MDTIKTAPELEPGPLPEHVKPTDDFASTSAPATQQFSTPKLRQSSMQSSDPIYGHISQTPRPATRSPRCTQPPSEVSCLAVSLPITAKSSDAESVPVVPLPVNKQKNKHSKKNYSKKK